MILCETIFVSYYVNRNGARWTHWWTQMTAIPSDEHGQGPSSESYMVSGVPFIYTFVLSATQVKQLWSLRKMHHINNCCCCCCCCCYFTWVSLLRLMSMICSFRKNLKNSSGKALRQAPDKSIWDNIWATSANTVQSIWLLSVRTLVSAMWWDLHSGRPPFPVTNTAWLSASCSFV